jgi:hypothetical protein
MPWNKRLSRPLVLKDGARLETLSDVRALFLDRFSTITHSDPIAYAGELLLRAAETGKRADIEAATEQIERALMHVKMMR